jgi:type I restriction enzyme R subunit
VRRLVGDARRNGSGHCYLIQHSAGSGKSFTIAWLAHRLATLHDDHDRRIFDSIVVVTDRRILDRQLQATMRQFEQTLGVVENIDTTSRQLKQALESGKTIIVTTLQKFPVIVNEIGDLPGHRFAVIVDEAHSSQTGESTKSLKSVLAAGSLEEAEREEEGAETPGEELEATILAAMEKRGRLPNLSLFAFTATPKAQDPGALRHPAGRREIRAVPPLHHAPGDRGGLHPRRPRELHDLQGLLAPSQEDRGRPPLRQE